jgi:TonB family protein
MRLIYLLLIILCVTILNCDFSGQYPFESNILTAPYVRGDTSYTPINPVDIPEGEFMPFNKEPVCIKRVVAIYPELAQRLGMEGSLPIRIFITDTGSVRGSVILKTNNEFFNKSVLDAVMQWKFEPAIYYNMNIESRLTIPFNFNLG